jgi:hypothetical protein
MQQWLKERGQAKHGRISGQLWLADEVTQRAARTFVLWQPGKTITVKFLAEIFLILHVRDSARQARERLLKSTKPADSGYSSVYNR